MLLTIERFDEILRTVPALLLKFSDEEATEKKRPGKWSKKQLMGHLIDSAANNHQRFVRMQIEDKLHLQQYRQNEWVEVQHYNQKTWTEVVELWRVYNTHLLFIMRTVKNSTLSHTAFFPDYGELSLKFLMEDYVKHMDHHLKQAGV